MEKAQSNCRPERSGWMISECASFQRPVINVHLFINCNHKSEKEKLRAFFKRGYKNWWLYYICENTTQRGWVSTSIIIDEHHLYHNVNCKRLKDINPLKLVPLTSSDFYSKCLKTLWKGSFLFNQNQQLYRSVQSNFTSQNRGVSGPLLPQSVSVSSCSTLGRSLMCENQKSQKDYMLQSVSGLR